MKKLVSMFLIACTFMACATFASATGTGNTTGPKSAEDIIEAINEEYGVNFYIPSKSETTTFSADVGVMEEGEQVVTKEVLDSLTPAELARLEAELRDAAEYLSEQKKITDENWQEAIQKSDIATQSSTMPLPRHMSKNVTRAKITFEGKVSDSVGYWRWTSLTTTSVRQDSNNEKYRFICPDRSYTYTLIDTCRTYAVRYKGTMYTKTFVGWMPADHEQYCEWHAGKPQ